MFPARYVYFCRNLTAFLKTTRPLSAAKLLLTQFQLLLFRCYSVGGDHLKSQLALVVCPTVSQPTFFECSLVDERVAY